MESVITDDRVRVSVRAEGPGGAPALLLLHSIGCDHAMWDAEAQAFATDFRVLRPDTRGHGGSDAPAGDYSLERLADDAIAVLDAAGVGRAVVCGLSLGGLTAQAVALRRPERVAGLVLANTAARIGSADAWSQRAALVRGEGLAAIADIAMERFFSDAFRAVRPQVVCSFRAGLLAMLADGYAGCCAALRDADLSAEVAAVAAPTLVIGGARDISTPPAQTEALAASIPGARHVLLDAAHLSNVERPEAFAAALRNHLETL